MIRGTSIFYSIYHCFILNLTLTSYLTWYPHYIRPAISNAQRIYYEIESPQLQSIPLQRPIRYKSASSIWPIFSNRRGSQNAMCLLLLKGHDLSLQYFAQNLILPSNFMSHHAPYYRFLQLDIGPLVLYNLFKLSWLGAQLVYPISHIRIACMSVFPGVSCLHQSPWYIGDWKSVRLTLANPGCNG